MAGRDRSTALQSFSVKKYLKNGEQGSRGKSIAAQSNSAIYTPKSPGQGARAQEAPVSYTHLTLPTKRIV